MQKYVLTLLGAAEEVLEEVDREVLLAGQVGLDLQRQEQVDLPLRLVLGAEGRCRDLLHAAGVDLDALHLNCNCKDRNKIK